MQKLEIADADDQLDAMFLRSDMDPNDTDHAALVQ